MVGLQDQPARPLGTLSMSENRLIECVRHVRSFDQHMTWYRSIMKVCVRYDQSRILNRISSVKCQMIGAWNPKRFSLFYIQVEFNPSLIHGTLFTNRPFHTTLNA